MSSSGDVVTKGVEESGARVLLRVRGNSENKMLKEFGIIILQFVLKP